MQRAILGAKQGTDTVAVLVRGGWLPLHYELALHAFTIFYKINCGLAGPAMHQQLLEFHNDDETWDDTIFYKSCFNNIKHLENYLDKADRPVLNQPLSKFKSLMIKAIEKQLSIFWSTYEKAKHTRKLLPYWKSFRLSPSHVSRKAEVLYYTFSFTQNETNSFKYKINRNCDNLCRACHHKVETISHIFLECPNYSKQRKVLFKSASKYRLKPTLCNLLTHPALKVSSEVFIQHTLLSK